MDVSTDWSTQIFFDQPTRGTQLRPLTVRDAAALSSFYFFIQAAAAFSQPFVPLFLKARGYDLAKIGALAGIALLGCLLFLAFGRESLDRQNTAPV